MNTRCYFDMLDNCVAYDLGSTTIELSGRGDIVDSGLYDFPSDHSYNPLGKTAEQLYMYSALTPA